MAIENVRGGKRLTGELVYAFVPREDITAFELAQIIHVFIQNQTGGRLAFTESALRQAPETIQRHFEL